MVPLTVGRRDQPTITKERYIRQILKLSNFKLINDNEYDDDDMDEESIFIIFFLI